VSVLHGTFDSTAGIAQAVAAFSGASPLLVGIGVIVLVSLLAFVTLFRLWHSDRARPEALSV
jgi:hypothetical protein